MTRAPALAFVLAVCLLTGAITPVAAQTRQAGAHATLGDNPPQCETTIEHTAFETNNATVANLANGSATSKTQNTRVHIEETEGFYKLSADNPNGYCVHFVVRVSEDGMPPAKIPGDVDSNDGNVSAQWNSVYDWPSTETYTQIEFTLPAQSNATFAPSKVRVVGMAWASSQATKAQSSWEKLKSRFTDQDVTKKTYIIKPGKSETVAVELTNPETDEKVTEWNAMYSTNGGETWTPVGTDTDDPVFYRKTSGGDQLQFTFADTDDDGSPDGQVRFTANPGWKENMRYDWDSYWGGKSSIFSHFGSGDSADDDSTNNSDDGFLGGLFGMVTA